MHGLHLFIAAGAVALTSQQDVYVDIDAFAMLKVRYAAHKRRRVRRNYPACEILRRRFQMMAIDILTPRGYLVLSLPIDLANSR